VPPRGNQRFRKKREERTIPEAKKRTDVLELKGVVEEALPNALYRVRLESGQEILAHLSGRMRLYHIKVLVGDQVTVQMTPYDLTKGRIVRREK
jgi:translation initiation factor IF-1